MQRRLNLSQNNEEACQTVVKQKFHMSSNHVTPSNSNYKKIIKRSTIRQLINLISTEVSNHPQQSGTNNASNVKCSYIIVAKIYKINLENQRYHVICSDQTYSGEDFNLYYVKTTYQNAHKTFFSSEQIQSNEKFQDLQFEPNSTEGHPYFKIILKLLWDKKAEQLPLRPIFIIEKITKIQDYNELTYHIATIMHDFYKDL